MKIKTLKMLTESVEKRRQDQWKSWRSKNVWSKVMTHRLMSRVFVDGWGERGLIVVPCFYFLDTAIRIYMYTNYQYHNLGYTHVVSLRKTKCTDITIRVFATENAIRAPRSLLPLTIVDLRFINDFPRRFHGVLRLFRSAGWRDDGERAVRNNDARSRSPPLTFVCHGAND